MSGSLKERDEQLVAIQTQKVELERRLHLQDQQVTELNEQISTLVTDLAVAKTAFLDAEVSRW
jgi:septal ring factor EnvC (AmiA/AmiB activator)